ncbi:universal stress protein [Caldivirga maquilingensis]|uniref:UspA domain protein n=1 Tax=Caldivirga maquilingensis (strain ATCC 700844 / DSM 13496 / JCM 10307 / IC-167) TaxID=397948 RepID=A8MB39_CALMQ|nr:universal stress protein [Caldivirga maquilingensis]ABW02668.1 UspA domain protein [Caldivirga maquilingensis IC-167]
MFSKILVATDGSQYSDKALEVAIGLAKAFNSNLYIIHVVEEDKVAMAASTMPIMVNVIDDMVKIGNEILNKAKAKASEAGVNADIILARGNAADKILENADKLNVDLIVVGSRGLRGLARFLLGSVSEKVARHSSKPVLIVK